jgi:hypothetical protein
MGALGGGRGGVGEKSSYSLLTLAVDGDEWFASHPGSALHPGKGPPVYIGLEAGWASELVWMQRLEGKSLAPSGDQIPLPQSVVRHYTDRATLAH